MHTKLTIPERLKDLRVSEKRMSLQELSDATGISSSTLGNYEKDENIDMSLDNLITLANFYNISTDYLLCRTELRCRENGSCTQGWPYLYGNYSRGDGTVVRDPL